MSNSKRPRGPEGAGRMLLRTRILSAEAEISTIAFHARERWFEGGLAFFAAGALVALLTIGLMWLPQLRVIAAVALVQALLGVIIFAWGLREARPPRWNVLRVCLGGIGHRIRQRVKGR